MCRVWRVLHLQPPAYSCTKNKCKTMATLSPDSKSLVDKLFVGNANLSYDIAGAVSIDPSDAADVVAASGAIKSIQPGIVFTKGQDFVIKDLVMLTINNSIKPKPGNPFTKKEGAQPGVYAIINTNGRDVKMKVEQLINPITMTGVPNETADEKKIHAALTLAMTDPASLPQTGVITDLAGLIGKPLKVTHSIANYERMVKAPGATQGEFVDYPLTVSNFRFALGTPAPATK